MPSIEAPLVFHALGNILLLSDRRRGLMLNGGEVTAGKGLDGDLTGVEVNPAKVIAELSQLSTGHGQVDGFQAGFEWLARVGYIVGTVPKRDS